MSEETNTTQLSLRYTCKTVATALFMLQIISLLVILIGAVILNINISFLSMKATYAFSIVSTLISTIFILKRYGRKLDIHVIRDLQHSSWDHKKTFIFSLVCIGFSLLFSYVVIIANQLFQMIGFTLATPDYTFASDFTYNILLLITTCVMAPICEELIFRGLILHALKRYGIHIAVFATSFLFALTHGNFIQGIPTFFMSILLCYMVLESGSILTSITAHFLNNAFAMLESSFPGNDIMNVVFFLIEIVLMILAVYYLMLHKDVLPYCKKQPNDYGTMTFFNNWVSILYLIFMGLSFLSMIILL